MFNYFGFGDFVFKTKSGAEVGRASDLKSLEENLKLAPDESILFIVGIAASIRVVSVILKFSSSGTLKSTRTMARLPVKS